MNYGQLLQYFARGADDILMLFSRKSNADFQTKHLHDYISINIFSRERLRD